VEEPSRSDSVTLPLACVLWPVYINDVKTMSKHAIHNLLFVSILVRIILLDVCVTKLANSASCEPAMQWRSIGRHCPRQALA